MFNIKYILCFIVLVSGRCNNKKLPYECYYRKIERQYDERYHILQQMNVYIDSMRKVRGEWLYMEKEWSQNMQECMRMTKELQLLLQEHYDNYR